MEKITTYTGHQYIDAIARTSGRLAGLSPQVVEQVLDELDGRIENFIDDIIDDIIEQFDDTDPREYLAEYIENLYGSLEIEVDLNGSRSQMAAHLRGLIIGAERELAELDKAGE